MTVGTYQSVTRAAEHPRGGATRGRVSPRHRSRRPVRMTSSNCATPSLDRAIHPPALRSIVAGEAGIDDSRGRQQHDTIRRGVMYGMAHCALPGRGGVAPVRSAGFGTRETAGVRRSVARCAVPSGGAEDARVAMDVMTGTAAATKSIGLDERLGLRGVHREQDTDHDRYGYGQDEAQTKQTTFSTPPVHQVPIVIIRIHWRLI